MNSETAYSSSGSQKVSPLECKLIKYVYECWVG